MSCCCCPAKSLQCHLLTTRHITPTGKGAVVIGPPAVLQRRADLKLSDNTLVTARPTASAAFFSRVGEGDLMLSSTAFCPVCQRKEGPLAVAPLCRGHELIKKVVPSKALRRLGTSMLKANGTCNIMLISLCSLFFNKDVQFFTLGKHFLKGQNIKYFGLVGPRVSIASTQLCHYNAKVASL